MCGWADVRSPLPPLSLSSGGCGSPLVRVEGFGILFATTVFTQLGHWAVPSILQVPAPLFGLNCKVRIRPGEGGGGLREPPMAPFDDLGPLDDSPGCILIPAIHPYFGAGIMLFEKQGEKIGVQTSLKAYCGSDLQGTRVGFLCLKPAFLAALHWKYALPNPPSGTTVRVG